MSTPHKLPWAVYLRVSTKDQGEKFSPIKQLSAAAGWAKANGVEIPGIDTAATGKTVRRSEFILFDQQTGKNDDRPDFQRARQLARERKIGGLLCYCVDRAARNVVDAINLRKNFKKLGVRLEFATQNFDDSPSGQMMYTVFAAYSEFEGQIILERTSDGRLRRVQKEGKLHNGAVRYGYRYENGLPIIEEAEAKIARIILKMGETTTAYRIFQYLNAQGYRTRKGMLWRRESVSHILQKALLYAGWYTYRHGIAAAEKERAERAALLGEEVSLDTSNIIEVRLNIYPPLIDPEAAKRIIARLAQNKKALVGRPPRKYLLTHFLWCIGHCPNGSICGHRWITSANRNSKYTTYFCGNVDKQHTSRKLCSGRQLSCEKLETTVLDAVRKYLREPEVAHRLALQDHVATNGKAARQERAQTEKRLAAIHQEQQHLDANVLRADLPARTRKLAGERLRNLEIEETDLKAQLRQASITVLPSKEAVVAAFTELLQELDHLETFEDKREFLEATISRIDTDGQKLIITGCVDTPTPVESTKMNSPNCKGSFGSDNNSGNSIPFKINTTITKVA